ncbi:MAG: flagellar export protein FliJ [Alphaproteobacteria bacterium]|nr:flagellar export protein FliJ [Alphaproteobacteria bacterium]
MAGNLNSLIRLHEWRVDEKRRALGDLLGVVADLEQQARRLEEDLKTEQGVARASPDEAGYLYGNYAHAVILRRERIAQSIAATEGKIPAARQALNDACRNLKKYALAQGARDTRQAREREPAEQLVLDELGVRAYRQRRR